jgi:hypothetical protein
MVVVARPMVDLAARMAALDLNRRVADRKLRAEPSLQVPDEVFYIGQRAITHHHVAAERDFFR